MIRTINQLLPYVRRYKHRFVLGMICTVITTVVGLLAPWVLKYAVDDLSAGVTYRKLHMYALMLVAIALVSGLFRFLMRRIVIGASRDIEYDLRNDFFAHIQRMPLAYFQTHRTGDLMSRATNDLNAVRMMIGPAVMYTADTGIIFIVGLTLMFSIDARLTVVALLPLPLASISVKVFGAAIHRRFESIQAQFAEISAVAQEALSGVRVVRAYRQEEAEVARFQRANAEYLDRNRGLIRLQGLFFPSMAFFLGLGALLTLWLGSHEVISGRITIGELVAFNAYLAMLTWPVIAFGWVTNLLQRGMASWKRMLEVFDAVPSVADDEQSVSGWVSDVSIRGAIEFRDLVFAYDGRPVLDHVSLRIEPGQTVALVGGTGSGKSTLVSLLPRLFDPPRGTVFIDDVDVCDIPLMVLRGAIGFVPQEPFLFSDTLADNIALGVPVGSTETEAVERAAAIARLDKDVQDFPKGYKTVVGERGLTLSGGQKQRTAIARAVMTEPRILVLDDALSSVDTYTEEEILARLRGVMRQRTSIVVSHRVSTVRDADRIFVLEAGRVVESGTHDALVRHNGVYAELYRKQLLEEELAEA